MTDNNQTIQDFGNQWQRFSSSSEGYHGSLDWLQDRMGPLIDLRAVLPGTRRVAEIGSGTGRIVRMLLAAGAPHVVALEPSEGGMQAVRENTREEADRVSYLFGRGEEIARERELDHVFSIGVLHHIPEPDPVVAAAFQSLRPGGRMVIWLYGYEGNELYVAVFNLYRKVSILLPDAALEAISWLLVFATDLYTLLCRVLPLPQKKYFLNIFQKMTRPRRKVAIFDQLNPEYAMYYRREEAKTLLERAGFTDIRLHHHEGYSWTAIGSKPPA